jgi:N-acetylglucosaminyl-diphospho-decaprenol L-rhamnosyltransferase
MGTPILSIVVLNYNTSSLLVYCLRSIQQYAPTAEVIVVDNASTDQSVPLVRNHFPGVKLIENQANCGFARGMNAGVRHATASVLLLLNADTELIPNTLPPLLQTFDQLPQVGILGPAQYLPDPSGTSQTGQYLASVFPDPTLVREFGRLLFFTDALAARFHWGPWRAPSSHAPKQVDWLMGAALLIRRTCFDALAGFDEAQFMYGEDWDICRRSRQAGWQVWFVPDASIIHHENAAGREHWGTRRQTRALEANLYFHEKHYGRTSRRWLAIFYLMGSVLRIFLLECMRLFGRSKARQAQ